MNKPKLNTLKMLRESLGYTQEEVCTILRQDIFCNILGLDFDDYKKLETKQISVLDRNVMTIATAMKFEALCDGDDDDYFLAKQFFPTSS